MSVKFPGLGAVVKRPIVDEEKPELAGIEISVKLVQAKVARGWMLRMQQNRIEEIKRIAGLREGFTADQVPEFWDKMITPQGIQATFDLSNEVLSSCLVGVHGVDVGGEDSGNEKDPAKLIAILEHIGLMQQALVVAIAAQSPKPEQLF